MPKQYTKVDVLGFLRSISIMSISAILNERPISSVVVFYVDNDLSLYFATKRDSFKAKALLKNPQISLSVWENNKMLVQAHGKCRETADQREYDIAMGKIVNTAKNLNNFNWPFLSLKGSENVVFKINIDWMRIMDLRKDRTVNVSPFKTIKS